MAWEPTVLSLWSSLKIELVFENRDFVLKFSYVSVLKYQQDWALSLSPTLQANFCKISTTKNGVVVLLSWVRIQLVQHHQVSQGVIFI